ncbi:hypothetical protein FRB99_004238 [Tulasnella sp. 403]|nr:hypothetical protein FRB99_004238 [Tulasnella sp. 403]
MAILYPVVASVVLLGLWAVIKFLDQVIVGIIVNAIFGTAGVSAVYTTLTALFRWMLGERRMNRIPPHKLRLTQGNNVVLHWKFPTSSIIVLPVSLIPSIRYAFNIPFNFQTYALWGTVLSVCYGFTGMKLVKLESFRAGTYLLAGLLVYDVWWVFGTRVMVTVATAFNAPIKLMWPKNTRMAQPSDFMLLGLGDVVIPGMFIALALRYDQARFLAKGPKSRAHGDFRKPYFITILVSYIVGLAATMAILHFTQHAQPALLYLSPACLLSFFLVAAIRGELSEAWNWSEERKQDPDEPEVEPSLIESPQQTTHAEASQRPGEGAVVADASGAAGDGEAGEEKQAPTRQRSTGDVRTRHWRGQAPKFLSQLAPPFTFHSPMAPSDAVLEAALTGVRYAGPAILLLIVFSLWTLKPEKAAPSPIVEITVPVRTPRRPFIVTLLSIAALTYLLDGTVVVLRAVLWKTWEGSDKKWTGIEVEDVVGLLAFGSLIVAGTWKDANGVPVWTSGRVKLFAVVAFLFEVAQVVLLALTVPLSLPSVPPHIPENPPPAGVALAPFLHLCLAALRLLVLFPLIPILLRPVTTYVTRTSEAPSSATANGQQTNPVGESSGLLAPVPRYGTFLPPPSTAPSSLSPTPVPTEAGLPLKPKPIKSKREEPTLSETWTKLRRLLPYLWPHRSFKLQFLASLCMVLLLIARFINLLMPLTLRELVDDFDKGIKLPMGLLLFYVGLRFLQGSGGLSALRDILWAPVMQYSDREMSQLSFDHLLSLSLAFHTRRKTGEILRILDRGAAINRVFEIILFSIFPTLLDIIVAMGAFFYFFGPTLCGITRGIHTDCLINYDTVKYFAGEAHEGERYRKAIADYQSFEYKVIASLNVLSFIQNLIISLGLLSGSLIVAWRIAHGTSNASDFVFFITYLAQLYGPLNTLGYIYRSINQNLIDTEKLLDLLAEPTEVNDKPDAPDLVVTDGVITFENVNFSYDNKTTALHDVTFTVPKGHSVALVGESGSGKSTILRLLFRQYDLQEGQGRILIDGQDVRDVTQTSLRKAIGVVPQDSVLFNASLNYNIGYGKFGATQEEIEAAATAAQLHDRILSFPEGYETKVGERGVRLSGGEKQRVSIARTFLKNSPILALDEATSALDTATEKDIQKALQNLLHGRTSISIAHRLSTIATADIILVLKNGQIIESGSHRELLARNGVFASMWAKQVESSPEVEEGNLIGTFEESNLKGYDVPEEPFAAPVPQVMPEPEFQQHPFMMPGPALVSLPPLESELNAVKADETPEAVADEAPASFAEAVKKDSSVGEPSVKAPSVQQAPIEVLSKTQEYPPAEPAPVENLTIDLSAEDASVVPSVKAPSNRAPSNRAPSHKAPSTKEPSVVPSKDHGATRTPGAPAEPIQAPAPTQAEAPGPIAFPLSPPQVSNPSSPVAFPSSDDSSSRRQSVLGAPSAQAITFKDEAPPGSGSGKEDKEPKRRRISSQNFQRLARRISLGRKGSSSSNIVLPPGVPSGEGSPSRQGSVDIGSRPSTPSAANQHEHPILQAAQAAADAAAAGVTSETESTGSHPSKRKSLKKKMPSLKTKPSS